MTTWRHEEEFRASGYVGRYAWSLRIEITDGKVRAGSGVVSRENGRSDVWRLSTRPAGTPHTRESAKREAEQWIAGFKPPRRTAVFAAMHTADPGGPGGQPNATELVFKKYKRRRVRLRWTR